MRKLYYISIMHGLLKLSLKIWLLIYMCKHFGGACCLHLQATAICWYLCTCLCDIISKRTRIFTEDLIRSKPAQTYQDQMYLPFGLWSYVTSSALTLAAPVGPPQSVQVETLGPDQLLATWKVLICKLLFQSKNLIQNIHKILHRLNWKLPVTVSSIHNGI